MSYYHRNIAASIDLSIPGIDHYAHSVLCELCSMINPQIDHARYGGYVVWPTARTIAKRLCVSIDTVRRRIKKLAELGYISVKQRYGKDGRQTSNLITIHMDVVEEAAQKATQMAARTFHNLHDPKQFPLQEQDTQEQEEDREEELTDEQNNDNNQNNKDSKQHTPPMLSAYPPYAVSNTMNLNTNLNNKKNKNAALNAQRKEKKDLKINKKIGKINKTTNSEKGNQNKLNHNQINVNKPINVKANIYNEKQRQILEKLKKNASKTPEEIAKEKKKRQEMAKILKNLAKKLTVNQKQWKKIEKPQLIDKKTRK